MADATTRGRVLYEALGTGDAEALTRLLAPRFRGELTVGLPQGLGRVFEGVDAMLNDGWGTVDRLFDMAPKVECLIDGGDVLVARGHYEGTVRSSGTPFRAAFAHFWSFDGARFTGVVQITDSAMWHAALNPDGRGTALRTPAAMIHDDVARR